MLQCMQTEYILLGLVALVVGCGSEGEGRGETDTDPGLTSITEGMGTSTAATMEDGDSDSDSDSDSNSDSNANTDGGDGDSIPKFDLSVPDAPPCGAVNGGGGGDGPLSYIWIANSSQGSVSKINTETMIEEGRYYVRPDLGGSPSRTSVSLSGDVAVASRSGGITKILGNIENCADTNGVPGIQTSAGNGELLPWGQDECIAWHTPLAFSSNRPAAWAQGVWSEQSCGFVDEKLWTSGANGSGTTQVLLLDGETGVVEQTINLPEVQSSIGLYGGAVDGEGNFWGIESSARLFRVDRDDFTYQAWPVPVATYGMAVDSAGRPWTCAGGGASRFDPVLQTWQTLPSPGGNQWGGCMTDGAGKLWHCRHSDATLISIDTETLQVIDQIPLPSYAHGISIDFNGYVWAVGFVSSDAYRVDPTFQLIETFSGLVGAYSYSDMTGFALSSAGTPNG